MTCSMLQEIKCTCSFCNGIIFIVPYISDRDSAPVQLNERPTMSQQDWESAVANAEDETDAQGKNSKI